MQEDKNSDLAGLIARLERETGGGDAPLPVETWEPASCGEAGLEIRADGGWWHQGAPFTRERLVRLFARLLRRDADGQYFLVTPAEKICIKVADAPFLAVRVERTGAGENQQIVFATNVGDAVALGPAHPLRVAIAPTTQEPRPYVLVRGRLEARLVRSVYYELADWSCESPDGQGRGVWSGGVCWRLG